jgi:outer membrane receptor protein involved in Fe transport
MRQHHSRGATQGDIYVKIRTKSALYLHTTALAVAFALPGTAFAQAAAPADGAACEDADANGVCDSEERASIVVTGSRIARPTLDSPVPLTSVSVDELTGTGDVSLGDALNDLPSLRSTFSTGSTSRNIFSLSGLSLLDLRGLGTDRTLVLINGRRHVTSVPGENAFDVNTIPIDLVERIDVVTGGNSAVYGSDAVAGVVNFVMKRNFDGIKIQGQTGISSRGDRGSAFVSGIFGRNFADGRGNFVVSAEYTRQNPLFANQRDELTGAYSGRCQFQTTDVTGGEPAAGDGIFDTTFLCGIKNAAISDGGTVGALDASSNPLRRFLRFNDNGSVVADTPTQSFAPVGSGNQQGGQGSTLFAVGGLLAAVDRYAFNMMAHYDFSEAFKPFIEAKYVRTDSSGEGQPSFFNSVPATLGGPAIRCNNGFLNSSALSALQGFGVCLAPATGTLPLARFNSDFGGRRGETTRETYRLVGGIEGSFNDDWKYEVAVNYGRFQAHTDSRNNLYLFDVNGNADGFNLAIDAVLAPGTFTGSNFVLNSAGQKVICRVNSVTNARPDCLPVNVFGQNNNSRAVLDFIHRDATIDEKAEQFVASAFVGGDLSQLFELPGGPISFAIGAEYRTESGSQQIDELSKSGGTFFNSLSDFCLPNVTTDICPDQLVVKEAYGELLFPLVKDVPGIQELSLNLAGRVSDYNNSVGTVYAYNIQGVYSPMDGIRFRAAYATSVRAPSQGDLFSEQSESFASIADPCDQNNIGAGPNRVANCAAAGVPVTVNAATQAACAATSLPLVVGQPWRNCSAQTTTLPFAIGGNPTLVAERGKSLTIGAVIEPAILPGFSLTIDYYDIEVRNLIASLTAQSIITLCYDSSTGLSNPACASVTRQAGTGLFADPAVISGGINFARQKTRGIDFDLAYRKKFDNGQELNLRLITTRVIELNNYINPQQPLEPNRQLSELGDPKWAANFRASYDFGKVRLIYSARFLGHQTVAASYETQNPYDAICPTSGITPNTGGALNGAAVPCTAGTLIRVAANNADAFPVSNFPIVTYHDIRVDFDVADKFTFYAGINNIGDRLPPLGDLGTVSGSPYDSFGRNFFFGFEANF